MGDYFLQLRRFFLFLTLHPQFSERIIFRHHIAQIGKYAVCV